MSRLPDDYFDRMYREDTDPWGFDGRWYEHRKRALTLAMLPRQRYRSAFEPGCSNGHLTEALAVRCDALTSTDIADAALTAARERLSRAGHTHVRTTRWALGDKWPDESFDLIVLSEVCYYLTADELPDVFDDAGAHLATDGTLLAAHWRHPVADYPTGGDEVHRLLADHPAWTRTARYADTDVLIETFGASGAPNHSVAHTEGLVD